MEEIVGDLWEYHQKGHWIVIPTNGTVKTNGEAVMGKGIALQAKQKFPELPRELGKQIGDIGNCLHCDSKRGLLLFPTKHNWWERSDLELIEKVVQQLKDLFDNIISDYPIPIYLPRVGCGNGRLDWKAVKSVLEKYLGARFVVVGRNK